MSADAQNSSSSRSPFNTGYLYKFDTSIDDGGEVSSQFFNVRASVPLLMEEGRFIGLSGAYYLNAYDFSGGGPDSLAPLDPWDNIHSIRLGAPIRWDFGNDWTFFGIPSVRFVGEDGAKVGDAIAWGGLAGFSYRFNDQLTLGPGIGYVAQIEDDPSIFPVILVDWKLAGDLSLSTGPTVGASLGPGLALNWQFADRWELSVGGRYEKLRFRLDENSTASPGGVGEDRTIPVFAAISYQASENWRLAILGGVGFGNKLELADGDGDTILERNSDPTPFVGVNAAFSF
jgi:hypothetical protein